MKPCKALLTAAEYWRSALRLDDWRLSLQEAESGELERAQCRARVEMQPHQRQAVIVLRSLARFDEATEQELVHEMLHVVFAQYSLWAKGHGEAGELPMEQALIAVGDLLVRLRRG